MREQLVSGEDETRSPAPVLASGALGEGMIPRPRLTGRLLSADVPLVLLEAPAGYAKSTGLALWEAEDERPFCWLSCRPRHNDPAALVEAVVQALTRLQPVNPDVMAALRSPTPDLPRVLDRLERAVAQIAAPFVLVIDDAHRLNAPGTSEVLEAIISGLPARSQLAISSRTRPDLPLGRLRAKRQLFELDKSDLAMTRGESAELLRQIDVVLEETEMENLHHQIEGWPAALYLAGLAIKDQGEKAPGTTAAFSGDDRLVVEYLRDEFFSGLSEAEASFLRRTSLLEELSAPLCDAVTGRSDSAGVLEGLVRSNALVIPLDRVGRSYRYHHLFADMLQSELRRREPEAENEIHIRAGRWYADNGQMQQAVDHAVLSDDDALAGELVWRSFPELSGRGQIATLERWLDQLGPERISSSPALLVTNIHRVLVTGHGADAGRMMAGAMPGAELEPGYEGDLLLLKATLGSEGLGQMGRDAQRASELLDPKSPWQVPCELYGGVARYLGGERRGAEPLFKEAVRGGAVHSPIIQVFALTELALLEADENSWDESSRLIGQARQQVERCGLNPLPSMSIVLATSALVRAHQGRTELAADELARTEELMLALDEFPDWYEVQLRTTLCRASLRLGDFGKAEQRLAEAAAIAERMPDAPVARGQLDEARQRLAHSRGSSSSEVAGLTRAELRTLQYLPSHHSFRAIAGQLQLSQNTVKTQANSLYRKLGANSRAEAVMIARRAGLLDGDAG